MCYNLFFSITTTSAKVSCSSCLFRRARESSGDGKKCVIIYFLVCLIHLVFIYYYFVAHFVGATFNIYFIFVLRFNSVLYNQCIALREKLPVVTEPINIEVLYLWLKCPSPFYRSTFCPRLVFRECVILKMSRLKFACINFNCF